MERMLIRMLMTLILRYLKLYRSIEIFDFYTDSMKYTKSLFPTIYNWQGRSG